jgi:LytS/YehU family sensor histidine kinase
VPLFFLAAAMHYLFLMVDESREAERRALELQIFAREAELKALRTQIDPHFLFNCLNSISALTTQEPAAARRMCLLLAEFLRDSLRLGILDQRWKRPWSLRSSFASTAPTFSTSSG